MLNLLRSWLSQRPQKTRPIVTKARHRPEVECLEDRVVPSISFSGTSGNTGTATLTGTSANDQFKITLQQPGSTPEIVFSDGTTTQTANLSDITDVVINGGGGNDTVTLDVGKLLNSSTFSTSLPIAFNDTLGLDVLNVLSSSNTTYSNVTETFTLGTGSLSSTSSSSSSTSSASTFTLGTGSGNTATNFINFTALPAVTAINDTLSGTSFVFNGNANNNLITIQNQGSNGLVIAGLNAQAMMSFGGGPGHDMGLHNAAHGNGNGGDDNGGGDDKATFLNFLPDQDETINNAFAPITLSNKASVTINGVGGDNLFVEDLTSVPTGLTSLTINGGTGSNVLIGEALPTGLNTTQTNIQREDTNANAIFIDLLYAEELNRPADDLGLNYWMGILNSSAGRLGVTNGITNSLEAHLNSLNHLYQHLLGRNLDSAGQNYWLGVFGSGATEQQVEAGILGSPEFMAVAQNLAGGTNANQNFIQAAYQLLLNRSADNGGLNYWQNFLQNNSTTAAALSMLQSPEYRNQVVSGLYQSLLGRNLDSAGQDYWLGSATQGLNLNQVTAEIEASPEFFARGKHHGS